MKTINVSVIEGKIFDLQTQFDSLKVEYNKPHDEYNGKIIYNRLGKLAAQIDVLQEILMNNN